MKKTLAKENSLCCESFLGIFAIKILLKLFRNNFPTQHTKFMHLSDLSNIKNDSYPFSSSDILQKLEGSY